MFSAISRTFAFHSSMVMLESRSFASARFKATGRVIPYTQNADIICLPIEPRAGRGG